MSTVTVPPTTAGARAASPAVVTATLADRWLALGLFGLAAGLASVSLLGPFLTETIHYHVSTTLLNQTIGLDAVSLVVVAPLAVAIGVLALRGRPAAPVLALGPATYTAYMFLQYVVGPEYLSRPGNSERFFPLFVVLFALGSAVAVRAWSTIELARLPALSERRLRLVGGVLLPLGALVAFSRYVPALPDAMSASPADGGYLAGPTFFWTIAMLDLGLALPAVVVACIGLLRGAAWGVKAAYGVVGWLALVGTAVAGMGIAMYANDDPNASLGATVAMTLLAVAFVALALLVYGPLVRTGVRRERA
jgi:uncharacterized protein YjeT (DUF2065 family)